MALRMDVEGMKQGLMEALYLECETLTDWLWTQVQDKAPAEVDRGRMGKEVLSIGGQVLGKVWAGGMMALVTEWGSGSLADTSNPAWDEYVQSQYWNPLRDPGKHTIRGRAEGKYINLDDETQYSTGKWPGRNLEWMNPPQEPLHWMREVVSLSRPYVLERLAELIRVFPFHRYIHDGR